MARGTRGIGRRAAAWVLEVYVRWVSPFKGRTCRFYPSCGRYALEAVERHGVVAGGLLAVRRLLRCHPLGGWGYDPVPGELGGERRTGQDREIGLGMR